MQNEAKNQEAFKELFVLISQDKTADPSNAACFDFGTPKRTSAGGTASSAKSSGFGFAGNWFSMHIE